MKCAHRPLNATSIQVQDPNRDVGLIGIEAAGRHVMKACDVEWLRLERKAQRFIVDTQPKKKSYNMLIIPCNFLEELFICMFV